MTDSPSGTTVLVQGVYRADGSAVVRVGAPAVATLRLVQPQEGAGAIVPQDLTGRSFVQRLTSEHFGSEPGSVLLAAEGVPGEPGEVTFALDGEALADLIPAGVKALDLTHSIVELIEGGDDVVVSAPFGLRRALASAPASVLTRSSTGGETLTVRYAGAPGRSFKSTAADAGVLPADATDEELVEYVRRPAVEAAAAAEVKIAETDLARQAAQAVADQVDALVAESGTHVAAAAGSAETAATQAALAQTARGQADTAKTAAQAAAVQASDKAGEASGSVTAAAGHATAASDQADLAEAARAEADTAATAAQTSADLADEKAGQAATSATVASGAAEAAASDAAQAQTARDQAVTAKTSAEIAAGQAGEKADQAADLATTATAAAETATTQAALADIARGQSDAASTAALGYADQAGDQAGQAWTSAVAAAGSADGAATQAGLSQAARVGAEAARTAADLLAVQAAGHAQHAADLVVAAAASATTAETKAGLSQAARDQSVAAAASAQTASDRADLAALAAAANGRTYTVAEALGALDLVDGSYFIEAGTGHVYRKVSSSAVTDTGFAYASVADRAAIEAAATNAAATYSAFVSAAAGTQTFLTKTEANTALASIPANSFVIVALDESQVGQRVLYRKTGGTLAFVRTIEERTIVPLAEEAIARQGNAIGLAGGLYGIGVDSLGFGTGAGGTQTSFRTYYYAMMRAALGDGGPGWMGFSNFISTDTGAGFGKHATVSYVDISDGIYGQYSIDGYGLYVLAGDGTTSNFNWAPNSRWTSARIVFLKGPGMGSFKWRFSTQADSASTLIDCSAASLQLGYFDITYTGDAKPTLVFNAITGNVCVFGGDFKRNDTGFRPALLAKGGRTLQSVAQQDATFRQAWFALLPFRRLILNGGMNDRLTPRSAAQHNADLTTVVNAIQAGNPNINILMVQSLEPADTGSTPFLSYAAEKWAVAKAKGLAFLDLRRYFGDYATANSNGWMLDGVHGNDKVNRPIAQIYAETQGIPTGLHDPGLTAWSSGGGTAAQVLNGSLTRKESLTLTGGVRTVLWKIGLINAFPIAHFTFTIWGNRYSTAATTVKRAEITLRNTTVVNQASLPRATSVPTVTLLHQVGADGGADPGPYYDFVIDVTINGGFAEIAVTPTTYMGYFSAKAEFEFVYHSPTATGTTVYEN